MCVLYMFWVHMQWVCNASTCTLWIFYYKKRAVQPTATKIGQHAPKSQWLSEHRPPMFCVEWISPLHAVQHGTVSHRSQTANASYFSERYVRECRFPNLICTRSATLSDTDNHRSKGAIDYANRISKEYMGDLTSRNTIRTFWIVS